MVQQPPTATNQVSTKIGPWDGKGRGTPLIVAETCGVDESEGRQVDVASLRPAMRHDRDVAKPWWPTRLQPPAPGHQSGKDPGGNDRSVRRRQRATGSSRSPAGAPSRPTYISTAMRYILSG